MTNYEYMQRRSVKEVAEARVRYVEVNPWTYWWYGDFRGDCGSEAEAIEKEIEWLNAKREESE